MVGGWWLVVGGCWWLLVVVGGCWWLLVVGCCSETTMNACISTSPESNWQGIEGSKNWRSTPGQPEERENDAKCVKKTPSPSP